MFFQQVKEWVLKMETNIFYYCLYVMTVFVSFYLSTAGVVTQDIGLG